MYTVYEPVKKINKEKGAKKKIEKNTKIINHPAKESSM